MDNKEILHNVVHCWTMSYIVMPNHSRPSPILCVCLSVCVMKVQHCHHQGDWGGPRFIVLIIVGLHNVLDNVL